MGTRQIEVCCTSMADVIAARDGGAVRVELCSGIEVGGLTPSAGLVVGAVREKGMMRVNVLIRPRAGDFVYSTRELAVMEADIEAAKAAGADGVVTGALTPRGDVDIAAMHRLLKHCKGLDVTFHRAFDECRDPASSLEQIIGLGIPRLLTSGTEATAAEGADIIAALVRQAAGRIAIMPGSGINPQNIAQVEALTGAPEYHSTCTDKSRPLPCASRLFGTAPRPTSAEIVSRIVYTEP